MGRLIIRTFAALVPLTALAQETILLRDGSSFDGRMTGATERSVTFRDNSGQMHRFDVDRVQSIQFTGSNGANLYGSNSPGNTNGNAAGPPPANGPAAAYPPAGAPNAASNGPGTNGAYAIEVPAGTEIAVRTNEAINARDTSQGTSYSAQVDRDVADPSGNVIIPRGSEARLVVRHVDNNALALDLQSVRVNGRTYNVDTSTIQKNGTAREGVGANKRTGEFVGGGAVLGTLLGAIAGGGKGAAIGALAGGGAGAGTQVLTRGDHVQVPAESVLSFRLDSPLHMKAT